MNVFIFISWNLSWNHNQTADTDCFSYSFLQILMNAHPTHVAAMAFARMQSMPIRVIARTGIQATIAKQVGR